jgi:glycosyltransferase involved in cell wall biosynthesis
MKPLFIISCPIDTYSGYGARSRDLVKAIIELDKYEVKVLPQRWGNTPWGFIKDFPEEWGFLEPHLLPMGNQLPAKPKIWAQVTVPNEFQPVGEFNIGFTAGIETTVCAPEWIMGLNRMNINFVSSEHAKSVFKSVQFEQKDQRTGQKMADVKLEKPVEVLFEGVDLTKYFPSKEKSSIDLSDVKENFAYLFVGHWLQGTIGEDRKNVGLMLKTFYETFKNKKKTPALILKTSGAGASYMDREMILDRINQIRSTVEADTLPNVYLLHGEFSDQEINELYNHKKVKAMINFTKGEGFGRPLLEFSLVNKPIITTNWSGHIDFLDEKYTTLLDGELTQIHDSALVKGILLKEGKWFSYNTLEASQHLINMFENYEVYKKKAKLQYHKSKNNFSFEKMKSTLQEKLNEVVPDFPKEVQLNLPKLKNNSLNLPKLELPKLKKVENV